MIEPNFNNVVLQREPITRSDLLFGARDAAWASAVICGIVSAIMFVGLVMS